jgi:hypothetical protein
MGSLDSSLFDIFSTKMLFGTLMAAGLVSVVSCSSCSKENTVSPPKPVPTVSVTPVPPPAPTTQEITDSKFTLTIPVGFKNQGSDDPEYFLFADENNKQLLSIMHQKYSSTYEEYVLEGIRSLKEHNAIVHSAIKTTLGNQEFIVVESTKDGVIAWLWFTTKDNIGYTITCGGLESSTTVHDVCFNLAKSFEIK